MNVRHPRKPPQFNYSRISRPLLLALFGTGFYVAIITYAEIADWAESVSGKRQRLTKGLQTDVSTTIAVVRVLQGLLLATSSFALTRSFAILQWSLMARALDNGISYHELLALSPTTLNWGAFRIVFHGSSRMKERVWSAFKLLMYAFVWLSGLVLFFRTSLVTVYDTATQYEVTAGFGPFNGSYVPSFFEDLGGLVPSYPFSVLPYSYYGVIENLVKNPIYSTVVEPVQCNPSRQRCSSYLLSGGIMMTTPWLLAGYDDYPTVRIEDVPSMQVEFSQNRDVSFGQNDCRVYGSNTTAIAAKLCLSAAKSGGLDAGIFVCKKGIADPACKSNEPAPNITTTVTFHRRQATVFASYLNLTITDVTDMTPTKPAPIEDLEAYLSVLDWILDYNKANVPAPSSIVQSFWSGYEQLDAGFDAVLLPTFHGLLAFPVFFFNANHYGNANLQTETISPDLPPEFYTTASIVAPYVKLKFDHVFLGLFIALQGIALIFLWVVVVWGFAVSRHLPDISSFPGFDVMFKTQPWNLRALEEEGDLWEKGDSEILRLMRDVRATSRKF